MEDVEAGANVVVVALLVVAEVSGVGVGAEAIDFLVEVVGFGVVSFAEDEAFAAFLCCAGGRGS